MEEVEFILSLIVAVISNFQQESPECLCNESVYQHKWKKLNRLYVKYTTVASKIQCKYEPASLECGQYLRQSFRWRRSGSRTYIG